MQLMSVDGAVEMKYMDILQEDDEEKRKTLEDGVSILTYVSWKLIVKQYVAEIYYVPQKS